MKRICAFLLAGAMVLWNFLFMTVAHAENSIYISQVQITGGPGQTDRDYIELFNPGNEEVNLKGWRLVKRTAQSNKDTLIKSWNEDMSILPHGFFLWANSSFDALRVDDSSAATLSDNNGIALRSGPSDTGLVIDSVAWGTTNNGFHSVSGQNMEAGKSLARVNLYAADSTFELRSSQPRNGAIIDHSDDQASAPAPVCDPAANPGAGTGPESPASGTSDESSEVHDFSSDVTLSEIAPNPAGEDGGHEAVELVNRGSRAVNLDGWFLDDGSTNGQPKSSAYTLSGSIAAGEFLSITIPSGRFTLNNTGDTVNLYFADRSLADQISYDGDGKEGESYQNIDDAWLWAPETLGEENSLPNAELADDASDEEEEPGENAVSTASVSPGQARVASAATAKAPAKKTAAKTATTSTATSSALERSMDKKLTTLQASVDSLGQESAQNFSDLSLAVQAPKEVQPENSPDSNPPARRSRMWYYLIAIVVLAGGGIVIFLTRSASVETDTAAAE